MPETGNGKKLALLGNSDFSAIKVVEIETIIHTLKNSLTAPSSRRDKPANPLVLVDIYLT